MAIFAQFEEIIQYFYIPYAMRSPSHHARGKTLMKQSKRTDLYVQRTGFSGQ